MQNEQDAPEGGKCAALIVAAGRGSRMGSAAGGTAKQYADLGGRAVLAWCLDAFLNHPGVATIQVVIHPDDADLYAQAIADLTGAQREKLCPPVDGGATRQASTAAGLAALAAHCSAQTPVLIHDAARPFIDAGMIQRLLNRLEEDQHTAGVVPALAVADTLKRTTSDGILIAETVPRDGLWRAQTPQVFRFATIRAAHAAADAGGPYTDDASIVETTGETVAIIDGDEGLRKLTTPADLAWARSYLARQGGSGGMSESEAMETRVGQGFDVHAFAEHDATPVGDVPDRVDAAAGVILCGVTIPHSHRLVGHSDADVGLHTLTDALLGAIGDGDIGTHFPPSEAQWKGANSSVFLIDAGRRVAARGGRIVHLDLTLICETPKIGPHRSAMVARVSELLKLAGDRISIKATTTERLGFPGRGEGIAALATATVQLPRNAAGVG
ncbi:MAG: bifunctional 2-C-methyl-D-erythritol 4-phosphate cytidylyltransferase/2-C-methyl-D-erythritol 2,4-cyclodiphosphate synthase [Pseudomonadota bacterium]